LSKVTDLGLGKSDLPRPYISIYDPDKLQPNF